MSASQSTQNSTENQPKPSSGIEDEPIDVEEDQWMIRDCDTYKGEYKECTSFRGRFHQYFIFGEFLDCNQWKRDYDNCCKWESKEDVKAAEAVIRSEKLRRFERFRAHYRNNIWKKRESPPDNWSKPLPEWMVKRDENTYLAIKSKEIREGKEETSSFCRIM